MTGRTSRSPFIRHSWWIVALIVLAAAIIAFGQQLAWSILAALFRTAH